MVYKKLYINLIVRIILITLTGFLLALTWFSSKDFVIMANILFLIIIQVILLIRYMNRLNQDIYNFFSAVQNDDSSIVYERMAPDKSFVKLYRCFDEVNNRIHELKIETVSQNLYMQNLIEHIGIGLLSFNSKGQIELFNSSARKLLKISSASHIDKFSRIDPSLPGLLRELKPGSPRLINLKVENELLKVAVRLSLFKVENDEIRLVSFQNIKNELEDNELDSYHKLIRILTHEIMNSTGPILSSIKTIREFITDGEKGKTKNLKDIDQELLDDIVKGLEIVEERSIGLSDFVKKFRDLTLLPKPKFTDVDVKELIINIKKLMNAECKNRGVELNVETQEPGIQVAIDQKLIEQVIINLINNSLQAFKNQSEKSILLKTYSKDREKTVIEIIDNGPGMDEDTLEKVFIPFFTTKEDGSGIGLSLSRQIMRLHNGKISIRSNPGVETTVTLEF